ncbi:hypothetical protein GCM10027598_67390 [Amycolatopsis oliviviridis]|uniref:Double-GTPase 2 domain-containing protein n=1 Tax=Amycolatopsis oliviviridis TaxID=1471590 RepID=A0ABQ3M129_9PSEU|nr:GTPase domain-containing protein [Amycolatopsis oliviviridis]GHH30107.1 hypothetical protein GCM10017790_63340 [Amycolatopsis oliviviridis]
MTEPEPPEPKPAARRIVLCPICVDRIPWPEQLFRPTVREQQLVWEALDLSRQTNPDKYQYARTRAYVRCPNPSQDGTPTHYLPAVHDDYGAPIVIGVVGRSTSGKTHLLITMLSEMLRGGLHEHDLTFEVADKIQHEKSAQEMERLRRGDVLGATDSDHWSFTSYLLVRRPGKPTRPLIFFDVQGEDFVERGMTSERRAQFVLGADALLFVDDPARGLPLWRPNAKSTRDLKASQQDNRAFAGAIARLHGKSDGSRVPAAIALTKADELRYDYPVDHWLRREDVSGELHADEFRAESRDVYAVLERYQAKPMLEVAERFSRCTLHFVSATGGSATTEEETGRELYPRGVRPMRVLQPILALLAMTDVLDGAEAERVGR